MTKKDAFTSSKTAHPPHFLGEVPEHFNTRFPGRWTGKVAPIAWPSRFPDHAPLDFLLRGFVKDRVFVPPLPANVVELRTRITAAVAEVIPEMLRSLWKEIDHRWDVCSITSGSHIEPQPSQVKLGVVSYIMTAQNTVHVFSISICKLSKL
jgi:hypothetical protein